MKVIGWTPALALGHAEIDAQHQELFRRAAQLLDAMMAGDPTTVGELFDFLGSYVVDHFAAEERLMTESGFPGYTVHKAVHERFVRDYQSLRKLHEDSGASSAVAIKARTWLVEWLRNHIGLTDQLLARHLLRKVS
jgi:hemerythrin